MQLIELPHKVCSMSCMINGLEDLYEHKTGVRLPDWLLVHLSGLTGFAYIKNKNAPSPRMVFWGSNIAKYQYKALADVVGFEWQMLSNRSFPFTLKRAKALVDQGVAPLLGVLDMFHLSYYDKFYHKFHIPMHHVLMVGYDDDHQNVLLLDCDRSDVQSIPYSDLEAAWNVDIPGLGKKNTFYTFEFNDQVADVETIARQGLRKRATEMLNASVSMLGIKGMRKLARELPLWPQELSPTSLEASLCHLVEFTGFPPVPPNRLTGYTDAPDHHTANRDGFANLLRQLATDYRQPNWAKGADFFDQSAEKLMQLTDMLVDAILGVNRSLDSSAALITTIADIEEQGFRLLI